VIGLQKTPKIYIFRLSEELFRGGTDQVIGWLRHGKHRFQKKAPTALPKGSIIIFSIEGKVVAEAVTKGDIIKTTPEEKKEYGSEFTRVVEFSTDSVRISTKPMLDSDIGKLIGVKKLARPFAPIKPADYFSIINLQIGALHIED
jgi:hypothetical protein